MFANVCLAEKLKTDIICGMSDTADAEEKWDNECHEDVSAATVPAGLFQYVKQTSIAAAYFAEEAAAAIGVSERSIRKHMAEIPHAYLGRSILIPVDSLRTWLKEGVGRNQGRNAEIEGEILTAICSGDENS